MLRKSVTNLLCHLNCRNTAHYKSLYSAAALGLENFRNDRQRTITQHMHNVDNFKNKMREFVAGSATNMIFTEDLKNIIHLAEENEQDKKLLVDMLEKYNSQAQELRFGNYVFGPVVMRALYILNDPALALKLFKNESYHNFFNQTTTYQILGDMLLEHKMYREVREVFDIVKTRQIHSGRYPKHILTLTFAACYKENTEQSYQYAMSLWRELAAAGYVPMRKATAFAAALALKHNQPGIALEIIGTVSNGNYVTVRQIKLLSLIALKRLEDIIPIFRSVLEIGNPFDKKQTFCREVIEQVKGSIEGLTVGKQDLQRMLEFVETNGHISESSLDQQLCSEVVSVAPKRDSSNLADSYRSRGGVQNIRRSGMANKSRPQYSRPGLADMN